MFGGVARNDRTSARFLAAGSGGAVARRRLVRRVAQFDRARAHPVHREGLVVFESEQQVIGRRGRAVLHARPFAFDHDAVAAAGLVLSVDQGAGGERRDGAEQQGEQTTAWRHAELQKSGVSVARQRRRNGAGAQVCGSETVTRAPPSALVPMVRLPPYSRTMSCTMARPMPWPGWLVSPRTPRCTTACALSAGMPGPSSSTINSSAAPLSPSVALAVTVTARRLHL